MHSGLANLFVVLFLHSSYLKKKRMNNMTTAIMNFTFAPLTGAFSGFHSFFCSLSKARAASELFKMGYTEEAKKLMLK